MSKKLLFIAAMCHAVNAAYCQSMGDTSQPTWADAPDWQRQSAIAGVKMHLANPEATPEESHASWLAQKQAEGWTFGPVKDAAKKEHPCFVPYDQLAPAQKAKDHLFKSVVAQLSVLPDEAFDTEKLQAMVAVATSAPASAAERLKALDKASTGALTPGFLPIAYVGRRETYREGAYGSKLLFTKGETKMVPLELAKKLLAHPDVYVLGTTQAGEGVAKQVAEAVENQQKLEKEKADTEQDDLEHARQGISTMNRAAMANYAKVNFNIELDPKKLSVEDMRSQVTGLLDRFGLPGSKA